MTHELPQGRPRRRDNARRLRVLAVLALLLLVGTAAALFPQLWPGAKSQRLESSSQSRPARGVFRPTAAQWAALTIAPVEERSFRAELSTDGKIAVNEDRATPIFSPYSGRVTRLAAKPGDNIMVGQLLFALEATDMVQAQNDFITAVAALETARSQLKLAQIIEKRQHDLYEAKAVPLKDWQQAQHELIAAQDNFHSAEIALEAVRNRLRILQKTEDEIAAFQRTGKINPDTPIYSPITGTVVQRKVGPGQYITAGASDPTGDPVFVIGDLSTVWLIANVRESDAPKLQVGQTIEVRTLAYPDRVVTANIDYVAPSVDPTTRRILVRGTIDNPDRLLKPEMFASVTVVTRGAQMAPAVPREAIIYEGDSARVWVATDDKSIELRGIKVGLINGNFVQVVEGLGAGEKVVIRGSLFIDRAATSGEAI
jgi:membrane fusion protein, heavy metal efflux system